MTCFVVVCLCGNTMDWGMSFLSIHPNVWCKHHGWGTKGVVFYYCCLCSLGASTISPSSHRSHARLHQSGSIVGLRNFLCRANGQYLYSSWLARSGSLLILPIILWCKEHLDQGENSVSQKLVVFEVSCPPIQICECVRPIVWKVPRCLNQHSVQYSQHFFGAKKSGKHIFNKICRYRN